MVSSSHCARLLDVATRLESELCRMTKIISDRKLYTGEPDALMDSNVLISLDVSERLLRGLCLEAEELMRAAAQQAASIIAHKNEGAVGAQDENGAKTGQQESSSLLLVLGEIEHANAKILTHLRAAEEILSDPIESTRALAWQARIRANATYLAQMKADAMEETQQLLSTSERLTKENAIFGLPVVSSPGQRVASSLSLESAKSKLMRLMAEEKEHLSSADGTSSALTTMELDQPDAETRRRIIHHQQEQLQHSFRRLEGNHGLSPASPHQGTAPACFDQHHHTTTTVTLISSGSTPTAARTLLLLDRPPSPQLQQQHNNHNSPLQTLKCSPAWKRMPQDILEFQAGNTQSRNAVAAEERMLGNHNAMEEFNGYVRSTQKKIAALQVAAGIQFALVPGGEYTLGGPLDGHGTLLPINGSSDRSSRLDRRTQYWLLSEASIAGEGVAFNDGPQHFFFATEQRKVHLPAFWISQKPLTLGQLRRLLKEPRFRAALPTHYLHPQFLLPNNCTQTFLCQHAHDVMVRSLLGDGAAADDDDTVLEVPFTLAERIAVALGCILCPSSIHEAALREKEGRTHVFLKESLERVRIEEADWGPNIVVDGWRGVHGNSTVAYDILPAAKYGSTFGVHGAVRHGAEWCSCLDVEEAAAPNKQEGTPPKTNAPFPPTTHVLRSCTDYNTQQQLARGGEAADRNVGFIGPALYTSALPNRGQPLAGIRLALPAYAHDAEKVLNKASTIDHLQRGRNVTFAQLVSDFCLSREQWLKDHAPIRASEETRDPLYRTHILHLLLGGFDASFGPESPHPLVEFTLYCGLLDMLPPPKEDPIIALLPSLERETYAHSIQTDHMRNGGVRLPCSIHDLKDSCSGARLAASLKEDIQENPTKSTKNDDQQHDANEYTSTTAAVTTTADGKYDFLVDVANDSVGRFAFIDTLTTPNTKHCATPVKCTVQVDAIYDSRGRIMRFTVQWKETQYL